ncbi:MAG: peptide deformylase [bacterium]|nr:peptide deformylase [Candidatus Sumerlaeota bacterium]
MKKLKIIKYEHPLLRRKSRELKDAGPRERELISAMAHTMYAAPGCGLAAPQAGVLERLFVADIDYDRDDPNSERRLRVFINPEILWESDDDEPMKEGCLSIPGIEGEIFRPSRIRVRARDENFEPFELEAEELLARVIMHETDHLDGILFVDRMARLKRSLLTVKLGKLRRDTMYDLYTGREETNYPVLIA